MRHALALGALLAVFVVLSRREVFSWPYYYDEADYMFAASRGWANYTDHSSQPLVDYIRTGIREGRDPSHRAALSTQVRARGDVDFYRHWHGPLYFYWLAALAPLHLDERATRSLSYVFSVLTAMVIYFGALWVFPGRSREPAALLSSALYLWSYATVFSNEIAPHQLFVLCVVAALVLVMKWRVTGEQRFWYGAVVAAACAFCTLEVAFVLLLALAAFADKGKAVKSLVLFLATVLIVWPAAVLKLSFAKAYLFMTYLALFRRSPWGEAGFFETWRHRFVQSPGEWILLAIAAVLYCRPGQSVARKTLVPVTLYGVLMLVALLRVNSDTPRYMLPFLPAFQIAAGFTLASAIGICRPAARWISTAAILLAMLSSTYAQIRAHPVLPAPRPSEVLAAVRSQNLEGKRLLAPQNDVPMIHYYLREVVLSGYVSAQERSGLLAQDRFDAVLNPGSPVTLQRQSPLSPHYLSQR